MFLKQLYIIASHVSGRASPPFNPQVSYSRTATASALALRPRPPTLQSRWRHRSVQLRFLWLNNLLQAELVSIIMYQSTAKCKSVDCCMIFK